MKKARYPQVRRPRLRYRKKHHGQDIIVLELHVPCAAIPWLEHFGRWFGPGVEKCAVFLLCSQLRELQTVQWNGAYGGREAAEAIKAEVHEFVQEPVNCGPGASEARAFKAAIAEIHGHTPA